MANSALIPRSLLRGASLSDRLADILIVHFAAKIGFNDGMVVSDLFGCAFADLFAVIRSSQTAQ